MTFKVTHIDASLCKRQQLVVAASCALAQAFMEQLYGEALAMAAVRQGGRP